MSAAPGPVIADLATSHALRGFAQHPLISDQRKRDRLKLILKSALLENKCTKAVKDASLRVHLRDLIKRLSAPIRKPSSRTNFKPATKHNTPISDELILKFDNRLFKILSAQSSLPLRQCKRMWIRWCQHRRVWDDHLLKHVRQRRNKVPKPEPKRKPAWIPDDDEVLLLTSWNIDKGFTMLHHFVSEGPQPLLYAFQETVIQDGKRPPKLQSGWNWTSRARTTGRGGGTGFCLRQGLNWSLMPSLCQIAQRKDSVEWTVVKILSFGLLPLIVYNVYVPPSLTHGFDTLQSRVKDSVQTGAIVLLLGDFNCDISDDTNRSIALRDALSLCGPWKELVNEVTHYPPQRGLTPHKLDSVIILERTGLRLDDFRSEVMPALEGQGHCPINVYVHDTSFHLPIVPNRPRYKLLADEKKWDELMTLLDWEFTHKPSSATKFNETLVDACAKVLGTKPHLQLVSDRQCAFWTPELTRAQRTKIRARRRLHRLRPDASQARIEAARQHAIEARKEFGMLYVEAHNKYYDELSVKWATRSKVYVKDYFGVIRRIERSKAPTPLPPAELHDAWTQLFGAPPPDSYVDDDFRQANLDWLLTISPRDYDFSLDELKAAKRALKPGRAPGLDGIPAELYKCLRVDILMELLPVFNRILCGDEPIPEEWKTSGLILLPKKTDPAPLDHRPISLLPRLYALFEQCLWQRLLKDGSVSSLTVEQGGFRPGRSCADQAWLLTIFSQYARARKKPLYALYLDFKKAFDSVPHTAIIHKLIVREAAPWFVHFVARWLEGHKKIMLNDQTLEPMHVARGVPQGSVLGPFLFAIFIDDLAANLKAGLPSIENPADFDINSLLYADDTTVLTHTVEDLQQGSNICEAWGTRWGMEWNAVKCKAQRLGSGTDVSDLVVTMNGKVLEVVKIFPYLGIPMQSGTARLMPAQDRLLKIQGKLDSKKDWFSPRLRMSSVPVANHIASSAILSSLYYGVEIHPLPPKLRLLVNKIARNVIRGYIKENTADTLSFLGWFEPIREEQKKLLGFVSRMLNSRVELLSDTMTTILQHHRDLFWVKRVISAFEDDEFWSDAREEFDLARSVVTPTVERYANALTFSSKLKSVWEEQTPEQHPALQYAPTTCSFTFRFWRGHMDANVGQAAEDRDGICYFCEAEKETVPHLIMCPDNPCRAEIDTLDEMSLEWLRNPTKKEGREDFPTKDMIKRLSNLHHQIWRARIALRRTKL